MSSRVRPAGLAAFILLSAAAAQAGTLSSATWFQVAPVVAVPLTRTTAQLGLSGSSTAGSIAVALSHPQFTTSFFVPHTSMGVLDLHFTVTQGGTQNITATPSMATGTTGIPGTAIVMTAQHVGGTGPNASMFIVGGVTLVAIPLSNGKAGQFTSTFSLPQLAHQITIDFYGWTPHTHVFASLTAMGESLPSVTAMGSFALDAMGVAP